MREPIDPDLVYKAGCGKKHGRHILTIQLIMILCIRLDVVRSMVVTSLLMATLTYE
jgi:hypothetical protein